MTEFPVSEGEILRSHEARAYALSPEEGRAAWFLGGLLVWKARGQETGGQFALVEQLGSRGFAAPLHVHDHTTEAFYVIEGEMTFALGDATIHALPGSFALVPPKTPHALVVDSERAKLLTFLLPADLEGFFEEIGEPATDLTLPPVQGPPEVERLQAMLAKYGGTIIGPPPEARW